ncbi:MAG TPA: acetate--CoA ligase family protein [Nakamurella sp.]|nr:acetate--CoA ligase family protein [Nakamurella sp.]
MLVSFGIGGLATELLDDRAYRAVPLTDIDAWQLIAAPRAAPLLDGYRGTRVVAHDPLIDPLCGSRPSRTISRRCPTSSCARCWPGRPVWR